MEMIKAFELAQKHSINLKKSANINFRSDGTNSLERSPEEDKLEKKKMSTGKKVALGTVAVAGGLALIDVCFNKSKCLKKIFARAEKETKGLSDEIVRDVENKGNKTYETYKQKLDGKMSVRVNNQKSEALEELANYYKTQKPHARNKALRDGKITEYTINHDSNVFRVKNGKIIEYRNANGEDILHTFNNATGANLEYQDKIYKIIHGVERKDKTALKYLDKIMIEGQEEALTSKDVALYIKNRQMPTSREVFSNGAVKEVLNPDEATRILITRNGQKEETTIIRNRLKTDKYVGYSSILKAPIESRGYTAGNEHYRQVNKTKDGLVEIIEMCDKNGKPIKPKQLQIDGHNTARVEYETTSNGDTIFLRTIRDSKDKGKVIKKEIISAKDTWGDGAEVLKTLIG